MEILLNLRYKFANIKPMSENNQKKYELVSILPSQLEGKDLENVKKEIKEIVAKFEGSIEFKEERKHELAYPVNKQGQGIYLISQVSIAPENVANLSKELKLNKQVLRHLIVQMPAIRPEKAKHEKPATAKTQKEQKRKEEKKPSKEELKEIDKKLDEIIEEI